MTALDHLWSDKHSCENEDCWGYRGYPGDWFRRMLTAAIEAVRKCGHCGRPLIRNESPAVGWTHERAGRPSTMYCRNAYGNQCAASPAPPRFIDLGAGIGTKCLFAARLGCGASPSNEGGLVNVIDLILYLIAAILFALAAFNVPSRVNLLALALLAWVLVSLLNAVQQVK